MHRFSPRVKPITDEVHRKIHELLRQGVSKNEISRRLKIGYNTVLKYARRVPATLVAEQSGACPAGQNDGWEPYRIDDHGLWLILSDVHVPYQDQDALTLAVQYARKRKIAGVILNGDIVDALGLSSKFLKTPTQVMILQEITALQSFFAWLRGQFPRIPIIWKQGNHEARLYTYILSNAPALYGVEVVSWEELAQTEQYGITLLEDDTQTIELGKLSLVHGHEFFRGFAPPVNPARGLYLRAKATAMCGHHHATSIHVEKDVKGKEIVTWSTGCLCYLRPRYARFNSWNHGFAIVELNAGGQFGVENLRIHHGRVT